MKSLRQQLLEAQAEVARLRKAIRCKREPLRGAIGGIIQQIREAQEIGLQELARASGVAAGLVSRIETKADANPTLNNLVKLASALKTPLAEIVGRWEAEKLNDQARARSGAELPAAPCSHSESSTTE